jgi:hypothetical protein
LGTGRGSVIALKHTSSGLPGGSTGWLNPEPSPGAASSAVAAHGFGLLFSGHVLLYVGEGGLSLKGQIPCPSENGCNFIALAGFS